MINLTRVRHNLSAIFGVPMLLGVLNRSVVLLVAPGVRCSAGLTRRCSESELERQLVYQLSRAITPHGSAA